MTKIIEALAALVAAGRSHSISITKFGGRVYVNMSHDNDEDARATADDFGVKLSPTGNRDEEWLSGSGEYHGIRVGVFGAHHPRRVAQPLDSDAVTAAVEQASKAVGP